MSATETILLIVLGFSLASLVALFMGRLIWTTAVRVGARRMQRQVPSSLIGLQTERDRLRAEYAMLAQRLGSRLEDAKLRLAEQMAEVSRHRNRLQDVERKDEERLAELRQLRVKLQETERALAASQALEQELRQAIAAKEDARRSRPEPPRQEPRQEPRPAPSDDAEIRLRQRIQKLSELAKAKAAEEDAEQIMAAKLAAAERQTRDLESELRKLDAEWPAAPSAKPPAAIAANDDGAILPPDTSHDLKSGTSSLP